MTAEEHRLVEAREHRRHWKRWGPYLSERAWGTVREDYSKDGNAWDYFPHDHARSRAYRWNEDGIAGICDRRQVLCFALSLWNGKDPFLKERLFGLAGSQGNHGEDVKELYYYLDSTPTHSYMKFLYKYQQSEFHYSRLLEENARRGRGDREIELVDTGVFAGDRYFDVFVEYAKDGIEDLYVRIEVHNRGPDTAALHLLPTFWFRNTWSWNGGKRPVIRQAEPGLAVAEETGQHCYLRAEGAPPFLFTENETNYERLFGTANASRYVKDGINDHVVHGSPSVNRELRGTKCAAHYLVEIGAGQSKSLHLRISRQGGCSLDRAAEVIALRKREADEFYAAVIPKNCTPDETNVVRQALGGMLWGKQYYSFNLYEYLGERGVDPMRTDGKSVRNRDWFHMVNEHVISMPDKWEYPWYAAWDLAFHTIVLALVDPQFAKDQLDLMLGELYIHPNGQIPAYEWNFSDVNPPVHAWAALFLHRAEIGARGKGDTAFL
ncbi:MAG: glucosidase, partial [Myxococcales bacterium]